MNTRPLFRRFVTTIITICSLLVCLPLMARAATFSIILNKETFAIGDEFTADVKMDTETVGVNAAQGTISFSPAVLSVSKVDRTNSVFNFWLQEPTFSNSAGTLSFLGGSTSGFAGASLETFKVTFKVTGIGSSTITFTDGAITASDGSGTNVMRGTKGVSITTVSKGEITTIAPPVQIRRTPTPAPAQKTPGAPALTIPLYPSSSQWSNITAPFSVAWALPLDVTDVATLVNKDPRSTPPKSEGLFDNKNFPALSDGTWYLHVQFKNANGWGPTTHYPLHIDTTPPPAFDVRITTGAASDNPTPSLSYGSSDPLSGIAAYYLFVDNNIVATTTNTTFSLPPQKPGKHLIRVAAHDAANNITESLAEITIAPLASPTVTPTNKTIFTNEGGPSFNGTALPNSTVKLVLKNDAGNTIAELRTTTSAIGGWSALFKDPLPMGNYKVEAITIDERGAQSYPVVSETISVQERPLLIIGSVGVTKGSLIWTLVLLLVAGVSAGVIIERRLRARQSRRILIARRDVTNAFTLIKGDLAQILDAFADKRLSEEEMIRVTHTLQNMHKNITSAERYIVANITEIKE